MNSRMNFASGWAFFTVLILLAKLGCNSAPSGHGGNENSDAGGNGNGSSGGGGNDNNAIPENDYAEGVLAALGEIRPNATEAERALFESGKEVALRRFDVADGLGPEFNVTFCAACHERPALGGSAALYRNFFIAGEEKPDGTFSLADKGGVIRMFHVGDDGGPARPAIPGNANVFAQRNPIPMFGMGLILEIPDENILAHEDPDDADGDGISGRANIVDDQVARLGRKAQTIDLEGFIRGPLFNHLGVTTEALTDEQRAALPFLRATGSSSAASAGASRDKNDGLKQLVIGDGEVLEDDDGIADPEMSGDDLFHLVAFSLLLAGPNPEPLNAETYQGFRSFESVGCSKCHLPTLESPRGKIPLFSDLLLHDMGEELADGVRQGLAMGSEFRTQPLWGIASVAPYLHDGRAGTIEAAILAHGGEAGKARDAYAALSEENQRDIVKFLKSLGGRDQVSDGLLKPDQPMAAVADFGGPSRELSAEEEAAFLKGRALFDRDFSFDKGVGGMAGPDGGPRFNGDSCRACHFDPVIGGAGPRGVNVMRHGVVVNDTFTASSDAPNTILHKEIHVDSAPIRPAEDVNVFEMRQTPPLFGLGLVDLIPEADIIAHEDPDDADGDGISGRAHILADGRLGRLGWKAQVPSLAEFIRDAMGAELGITLPPQDELTFGLTEDGDAVTDPELGLDDLRNMQTFLELLAPPPRQPSAASAAAQRGEALFTSVGCAQCHTPSFTVTADDKAVIVPLFSDLLLHEVLKSSDAGIEDGDAGMREFRTPPLWGLSRTAPYLHDGSADAIEEAILGHRGEANGIRRAFTQLSDADKADLLAFLNSL